MYAAPEDESTFGTHFGSPNIMIRPCANIKRDPRRASRALSSLAVLEDEANQRGSEIEMMPLNQQGRLSAPHELYESRIPHDVYMPSTLQRSTGNYHRYPDDLLLNQQGLAFVPQPLAFHRYDPRYQEMYVCPQPIRLTPQGSVVYAPSPCGSQLSDTVSKNTGVGPGNLDIVKISQDALNSESKMFGAQITSLRHIDSPSSASSSNTVPVKSDEDGAAKEPLLHETLSSKY